MCQNSSLIAAAEGPVVKFSSFANFEEKKRKSNLLMSFPKPGNQMGSFGQIRKKSFFRFCRPILDIFGFTLLNSSLRNKEKSRASLADVDICLSPQLQEIIDLLATDNIHLMYGREGNS